MAKTGGRLITGRVSGIERLRFNQLEEKRRTTGLSGAELEELNQLGLRIGAQESISGQIGEATTLIEPGSTEAVKFQDITLGGTPEEPFRVEARYQPGVTRGGVAAGLDNLFGPTVLPTGEVLPATGRYPQQFVTETLFPTGVPAPQFSGAPITEILPPVPTPTAAALAAGQIPVAPGSTFIPPQTREQIVGPISGATPEQGLFTSAAAKEKAERMAAIKAYLEREEARSPGLMAEFEALFAPSVERGIRRGAEALGAQGLGSSGFQGSGAIQELVRKASQEASEKAGLAALGNLLEARKTAGLLELEAAEIPSTFRRAGLQRRLGLSDIAAERGFQREMGQFFGESQERAARESRPKWYDYLMGGAASAIPYAAAYKFAGYGK